ncbi:uncharacterized protein BCR38DRAFT_409729 [Pseudomassariella vexata]|uniref:Cytochrome b5 heme-binding domain-containing protein n=1 Tax=Pseudomassariella vexata TaxID=1141098 RepID=A0A1Y2E0F6_9PEZI|nr:uncharacterized protein BCR38DRAFT_409729 [Pseudomassariella vexata]ORY64355.1 hypothetical protein BCR38DRAFT_409729 [Pseudomassariella vexata]
MSGRDTGNSSVRQRKGQVSDLSEDNRVVELSDTEEEQEAELVSSKPKSVQARVDNEDDYSPWVDVLRVITFLIFGSCALSYLISSGESFTWGLRHPPKYLNVDWWKAQLNGPLRLTLDELAQYDGTDDTKPLYLAINGSIYDVSSNRRTYGPGGSYHIFAGVDASRGFVTGCFGEDRTADMRGVEEMFIPLDDPEVDRLYTAAELEALKKEEREQAEQKVYETFAHWAKFFENSAKYQKVGEVKREKNWLEKEPRKKLCDTAAKGRPKRKAPEQK